MKRTSARAAVLTVLAGGMVTGGFGMVSGVTATAVAHPGDHDNDHGGLGGIIHRILGGGSVGGGGDRHKPEAPAFGKSLHGATGGPTTGSSATPGSGGSGNTSKPAFTPPAPGTLGTTNNNPTGEIVTPPGTGTSTSTPAAETGLPSLPGVKGPLGTGKPPKGHTQPGSTGPSTGTGADIDTHDENKTPAVTINMGGRTIVIWKHHDNNPHGSGTGTGTGTGPVITLPDIFGGGTAQTGGGGGGGGGSAPQNPEIRTGPIGPSNVTTMSPVVVAAPPAPPAAVPPPPPPPPVAVLAAPTPSTGAGGPSRGGGDIVVTAEGAPQHQVVAKPIEEYVASSTVAPRTGYTDYLRVSKTSEIAAVALPGVAGIALFTLAGGAIGYRQAKAGHAVRASAAARFLE